MFARSTLLALLLAPVLAQSEGRIDWAKDLPDAFAKAKASEKIQLICVNAKFVDGRKTEERANKGLREVVYKDPRVVARSREFVCVLFTPGSRSSEFAELRALGIEGEIVSPQHIFLAPEGNRILLRRLYWRHGQGEAAVQELLAMMTEAQKRLVVANQTPEVEAEAEETPAEPKGPTDEERPGWILERIREVVEGAAADRQRALGLLVAHDREGDCTNPLIALLPEHRKNSGLVVDVIRGLGRDQLLAAALPITEFLADKENAVRGNAAVSLEYIGSRDKKVVAALRKAVGKEKNEEIANHLYRALGRCGAEDSKTRSLLLKKCASAKSEFASWGPTIGLAYFEGDSRAARGLEKILKKIGVPGSRRGGGQNTVKRGVLCWTLASIRDFESGKFMREELIAKLEHVKAFWVDGLRGFYTTVARRCESEKETTIEAIAQGVHAFVGFAQRMNPDHYDVQARSMMDEYRKGREDAGFTPKGDYLMGPAGDS